MIKNILTPFQRFVKTESLAGMLLFAATLLALFWANSPWGDLYDQIWKVKIGFSLGNFELKKTLILWINDGLMAVFFFLIGLELKRELLVGELNSVKKAVFPFWAALGGVVVPILLFVLLNDNAETVRAWGIPMATDIAFALAILMLLGDKVPISLKVFLTAFAIIDDLAAVLVIAVFYSAEIYWSLLLMALLLIGLLAWINHKVAYRVATGLLVGSVVWVLFLKSGIHPTIAGVLLAFAIPIKQKIKLKDFGQKVAYVAKNIRAWQTTDTYLLSKHDIKCIDLLNEAAGEVRSPLQFLEQKLHGLIAYFVLPVFAFANAGIRISSDMEVDNILIRNIALALFVGKLAGVSLFTWIGLKIKLIIMPSRINFKHIVGISAIAGVGFTMSIFIANLAFAGQSVYINSAKIGIIVGSFVAGISGYLWLRTTSLNS